MSLRHYELVIRNSQEEDKQFSFEFEDSGSVLDALDHIRYTLDPGLGYRHSCHHGSCGTCACIIDGRERLACMTLLSEFGQNQIVLEPLKGFPVVYDLVVDLERMIGAMPAASYTSTDPDSGNQRLDQCIECGCCSSACPVSGPFLGPAVLTAIHTSVHRDPDTATFLQAAYGPEGVDSCESHFECSRVCPMKVAPGRHIRELKTERKASS